MCRYFSIASKVHGLPKDNTFVDVSCGFAHTAALTAEGYVYTWGLNDEGQLGWTLQQIKAYHAKSVKNIIEFIEPFANVGGWGKPPLWRLAGKK